MQNPKVLLCAPVSSHKHYILWKWLNYIQTLTYKNYEILLIDNSHDPHYHKQITRAGINCIYYKPQPNQDAKSYIVESRNIGRQYAIDNNFDYFFSLEEDIFTHRNIIELLLRHNKKVCGGAYFIGEGRSSHLLAENIHTYKYTHQGKPYTHDYIYTMPAVESFLHHTGQLRPSYGHGLGCLLIHKHVFTLIPFRVSQTEKAPDDHFFNQDMHHAGIQNYLDTSIQIIHHNNNILYKHHDYKDNK